MICTMNFKQTLLIEPHLQENQLLIESVCKGLTQNQIKIIRGIYSDFIPLIEASLTVDQITQIFQQAKKKFGKNCYR